MADSPAVFRPAALVAALVQNPAHLVGQFDRSRGTSFILIAKKGYDVSRATQNAHSAFNPREDLPRGVCGLPAWR